MTCLYAHKWELKKGIFVRYYECKDCGKRKIDTKLNNKNKPIDYSWLAYENPMHYSNRANKILLYTVIVSFFILLGVFYHGL